MEGEDFSPEAADFICSECYLNSEEYEELSTHSELFQMAIEYLNLYEIGLADPSETYSPKEKQAIALVHQELERWKADEIKAQRVRDQQDGHRVNKGKIPSFEE